MSQHFLLSAKARTLTLSAAMRMTDQDANAAFAGIRWAATDGKPVCPHCDCPTAWDCRKANGAPALALHGVPQVLLRHARDFVRVPQATDPGVPRGDCDFLQRSEGQVRPGAVAGLVDTIQDGVDPGALAARSNGQRIEGDDGRRTRKSGGNGRWILLWICQTRQRQGEPPRSPTRQELEQQPASCSGGPGA